MNMLMSGRTLLALAIVTLGVGTASAAGTYKSINNGANLYFDNTYGSAGGGEFNVKSLSGVSNNTVYTDNTLLFKTFCVEENQNINIPSTDVVTVLSLQGDIVKNGAGAGLQAVDGMKAIVTGLVNNASGATNYLTYGAAALYKSFASAYDNVVNPTANNVALSILGQSYTMNQTSGSTDENLLQRAIWYFQGQANTYGTAANANANNKYIKAVADAITAGGGVGALNIAGVEIMNLKQYGTTTLVQSQLHWNGSGRSTDVPEPASVMMWMSLAGIGAFVRRRRSLAC